MSYKAISWALNQELPAYEKITLVVLSNYSDETGLCWPGNKRLADDCGMSMPQARKMVASLEKRGLLVRTVRKNGTLNASSLIRLSLNVVPLCHDNVAKAKAMLFGRGVCSIGATEPITNTTKIIRTKGRV